MPLPARRRTRMNPSDTEIPALCRVRAVIRPCSPWHPPQVGPAFPRSAPSSVLYSGFGADSGSSVPFISGFGAMPSRTGLRGAAKTEVSGRWRLGSRAYGFPPGRKKWCWALRLRGTPPGLVLSADSGSAFPFRQQGQHPQTKFFGAQSPSPSFPLFTLRQLPHDSQRKTRGQNGFAIPFL